MKGAADMKHHVNLNILMENNKTEYLYLYVFADDVSETEIYSF